MKPNNKLPALIVVFIVLWVLLWFMDSARAAEPGDNARAFCSNLGAVAIVLARDRDEGVSKLDAMVNLLGAFKEKGIDPDSPYGVSVRSVLESVYAYPRYEPGREGVLMLEQCLDMVAGDSGKTATSWRF